LTWLDRSDPGFMVAFRTSGNNNMWRVGFGFSVSFLLRLVGMCIFHFTFRQWRENDG
jgi:hypothetical protein